MPIETIVLDQLTLVSLQITKDNGADAKLTAQYIVHDTMRRVERTRTKEIPLNATRQGQANSIVDLVVPFLRSSEGLP